FEQAKQYLSRRGGEIASGALAGVRTVGEILFGVVLAMILSIYFVHSGDRLVGWIVDLAPRGIRRTLRESGAVIFDVVSRYIRGVALVGMVDGFFIGIAAVAAVVLWILYVVQVVVLPIILGMAITTLLLPPYRRLRRHGLSRALATAAVCLGGFLLLAALVALLVPPTVAGVAELRRSFGKAGGDLQALASSLGLDEKRTTELFEQAKQYLSRRGGEIASGALAGVRTVGEILFGVVLAMILSIYFVHSGDRLVGWIVDLAPRGIRRTLRESGAVIFDVVSRYIRGVALVGMVDGRVLHRDR
ncbi:AI-2E family transporter, partial [Streptosporangium minutum]